jgi:hypothetical protein
MLSATLFTNTGPHIALDNKGLSALFVGEPSGVSIDGLASRRYHLTPSTDWSGDAAAARDYSVNNGDNVQSIDVNKDGSMLVVRTTNAPYILGPNHEPYGILDTDGDLSYKTNRAVFLEGHTTASGTAATGGMVAVAPAGVAAIDIFDTHNFQRIARIPVRSEITGPLLFIPYGGTGNLVLAGVGAEGLIVVHTSITELLAHRD